MKTNKKFRLVGRTIPFTVTRYYDMGVKGYPLPCVEGVYDNGTKFLSTRARIEDVVFLD